MEFSRRCLTYTLVLIPMAVAFNGPMPAGTRETCLDEGQPVNMPFDANCYFCVCKNGYVECTSNCPRTNDCHFLMDDKDSCCEMCKGCVYKGKHYQSHTEWFDPLNPCKTMRCEAGIVTVSDMKCYTPCPNPLPPEPGKCCPTCPDCQIHGQVVAEDRDVIWDNDPCVKCQCSKGQLSCSKKACPVLQCSEKHQITNPGECCPRCNGSRKFLDVGMSTCMFQQKLIADGGTFQVDDKCIQCSCTNRTSVCNRMTCPILECPLQLQRMLPNKCCPDCERPVNIEVGALHLQCEQGGHVYQDGEVWKLDACSSCKCEYGAISCARTRCNSSCASGMRLVRSSSQCCPRCVEKEGTCMAFGDPHYKTFDGKLYSFKGHGRYQLIEDIRNNSFSVKVANEHTHAFMESAITKRVAVNFGAHRLNLQQRLRVKYDGKKVTIPFEVDGLLKIDKYKDSIKVQLNNGVVILWNGRSFLEVTVPPSYKGVLRGLCGNFNGDIQDDLQLRNGTLVGEKDMQKFGISWCAGKRKNCSDKNEVRSSITRSDLNHCKLLKNEIFETCDSKLSNDKYYKACKMDMYNCSVRNRKCYCESFMAYSRECERMGVNLTNWQKYTQCDAENRKRSRSKLYKKGATRKHSRPYPSREQFQKTFPSVMHTIPSTSRKSLPIN